MVFCDSLPCFAKLYSHLYRHKLFCHCILAPLRLLLLFSLEKHCCLMLKCTYEPIVYVHMKRRCQVARKSSLPEDVTRFKPCKCARIRNDGGVYRVYKYSAVKLASGNWSSDYGYLIRKIVAGEGFFPNKRYQKELAEQNHRQSTTLRAKRAIDFARICWILPALASSIIWSI